MRAQQDTEEVTSVQKQRDKLLQWDAETHQQIIDLMAEAKRERGLRLVAEERSMALEQRAKLDAETVTQLHGECDEQCQTSERLHLECGMVHRECDQAVREHDEVQLKISSLQAKLDTTKAQKLEAEGAATGLAKDLAGVRSVLQAESDKLELLKVGLSVIYDDLQVVQAEGTSSLVAHDIDITMRVRQLEKEALCSGITQAFTIARSHYDVNINLRAMSLGVTPGYELSELDEIEAAVAPLVETLASKVEDIVLP